MDGKIFDINGIESARRREKMDLDRRLTLSEGEGKMSQEPSPETSPEASTNGKVIYSKEMLLNDPFIRSFLAFVYMTGCQQKAIDGLDKILATKK